MGPPSGASCETDATSFGPAAETQEILYAELDLDLVTAAKRMLDAAGHYARRDVFRFEFDRG